MREGVWKKIAGCNSTSSDCCCCCCACVWALCSAAAMRRVSIDATGARCAGRAWGVLCCVCGAVTCPRAQSTTTFFADCSKRKQHTEHRMLQYNTQRCHRCCICTLPTLRRMTLPAFAVAGLALAWPHHKGHAVGEIVAWCGANHLP